MLLVLSLALGCSAGGGGGRDSGAGLDAGRDAGTPDSGPARCSTSAECDDGFPCTLDECVVGNVCRHDPLDARCGAGEACVVGRGCVTGTPTDCTVAADCDDGRRCNGTERCIAGSCFMGTPLDCDDGNECTTDTCDEAAASACRYDLAPGCDAGTSIFDGGITCDPFDPAVHYPGTFTFRPGALSACTGSATFNVSEIIVSRTGSGLSIRADRFTLTQSPAPEDGTFDATSSDGCSSIRLRGMFTCADRWEGNWTADFSGSCSFCAGQNMAVRGSRR